MSIRGSELHAHIKDSFRYIVFSLPSIVRARIRQRLIPRYSEVHTTLYLSLSQDLGSDVVGKAFDHDSVSYAASGH
jgi:hypothetical protein